MSDKKPLTAEDRRLRDMFACSALSGIVASETTRGPKSVAKESYELADAMMDAREPKQEKKND